MLKPPHFQINQLLIVTSLLLLLLRPGLGSPPLLEALDTAAALRTAGGPALPARSEDAGPQGVVSILQAIHASLLKIEDAFFAPPPPCNATGCNRTAGHPPGHGAWRGRHSLAAARQILSEWPAPTPTPPFAGNGTGDPGTDADGFYDGAPDDDLPALGVGLGA